MAKRKLTKVSIPSEYKTYRAKVRFLVKGIKKAYFECGAVEKTAAEHAIRLGSWCLTFKALVKKHKKEKWDEAVREHLPHLSIRTLQRYMKLARKVDLDQYPVLAFLGQTRLYQLAEVTGKNKIHDLLNRHDSDIEIDTEDGDSIESFKHEVDELIERLMGPKPDEKAREEKGDEGRDDQGDDNRKEKKQPVASEIVEAFSQSATAFIGTIDSFMKSRLAMRIKREKVDGIVRQVEVKLAALKKLRKSLGA